MRFLFCVIICLVCGRAAPADFAEVHRAARAAGDAYQDCLADRFSDVSHREKMTESEFVEHIAGACTSFRERYRAGMLEFMSLQFPMMGQSLQTDSANDAVIQMQKDIVRAYARGELHLG